MAKHEIGVHEGSETQDELVGDEPTVLRTYVALVPLFKEGKRIPEGGKLQLDPFTAENHIKAGDIKELDK